MPDPAHHQYEGELISSSYHVEEVDETRNAFEHMQGGVKNVQKEPEDVHIGEGGRLKPIKITKNLSREEKFQLIEIFKEYRDVFA